MTALFYIPHTNLILLVTVLCVILILQCICMFSSFFIYRFRPKILFRSLLEASVLLWQFLLLMYMAEVIYHIGEGFLICTPNYALRYGIFTAMLLLSVCVCISEGQIYSLSIAAVSAVSLPWAERLSGSGFSILIVLSLVFWAIRAVSQLINYRSRFKRSLSEFSVKEAIDTMDFGVLFCSAEKGSDGQILLANEKMQQLIMSLRGEFIYDGRKFYKELISGSSLKGRRLDSLALQPVYALSDGSVWRFSLQYMSIKNKRCAMLLASDMTEQEKINSQLYRRRNELQQRNKEIKAMLSNLKSICQAEQTLEAKTQVHAVLGQQISLLLRSVREQREPDEALLRSLAGGLTEDLKNNSVKSSSSLKSLIRNFESLGIIVHLAGSIPRSTKLQKAFYDIIAEAMTNSVHHAYASEIYISSDIRGGNYLLNISDNGVSEEENIQEGGGLRNIRQKVTELGGEFFYKLKPHFSISVQIPEEADYD